MLTIVLDALAKRKGGIGKWLKDRADFYIDAYEDRNYDFERNGEALLLRILGRHKVAIVFDVGANVGDWSLAAARSFPQAEIHAFELSERTRSALKRRLVGNRFSVPDLALGSSSGRIQYKDYGEGSTLNTTVASEYHDATVAFTMRESEILRGDDYVEANAIQQIDLLKIDVEGAEYLVLEGFMKMLSTGRIRVIQFEYGYANGDAGHLMKHFFALLERGGYRVGRLWSQGVLFGPFTYAMNNFLSGPNYVAVHHAAPELIDALQSR